MATTPASNGSEKSPLTTLSPRSAAEHGAAFHKPAAGTGRRRLDREPLPAVLRNDYAEDRTAEPSAERSIRRYEEHGHMLGPKALENLRARSGRRAKNIADKLASASARFGERREELERISAGRQGIEAGLHEQASALCLEIVEVAAIEAADGVREFADGILLTQNRLGDHTNLLRQYTGTLVSELRKAIQASEVFHLEPLLPWGQDSISEKAIGTCEAIIADRRKAGDRWDYDSEEVARAPDNWPSIALHWEGFKEAENLDPSPLCEVIPESALRAILSRRFDIRPQDVEWGRIHQAAADLCRHYGPLVLLPEEGAGQEDAVPGSIANAHFWKEREEEFRKHRSEQKGPISASWVSTSDHWSFDCAGAESLMPRSVLVFKSLAREAARGLDCPQCDEQWVEWLNALRRTKYAKISVTSLSRTSERELERKRKVGERVPAGGMIRFGPIPRDPNPVNKDSGQSTSRTVEVETDRFWEGTIVLVEDLLNTSADFCLELRSLAPTHSRNEEKMHPKEVHEPAPKSKAEQAVSDQQELESKENHSVERAGTSTIPAGWNEVEITFLSDHRANGNIGSGESCPPVEHESTDSQVRRGTPRTTPLVNGAEVEAYVERVTRETGCKVGIKEFCIVAGRDPTLFSAWRRGDEGKCKMPNQNRFSNVLNLTPGQFMVKLKEKS